MQQRLENDFPEFLAAVNDEDKIIQEKAAFYLKERGLDNHAVMSLSGQVENLKKERERLENENERLSTQNKNLLSEIEELKQYDTVTENTSPDKEESGTAPSEERFRNKISELESKIKTLKNENSDLKNRIKELESARVKKQNETSRGIVHLEIPCDEKNLFVDELEDYLYALLYSKIDDEWNSLPDKEVEFVRKRHVLKSLIERKCFTQAETETVKKLDRIKTILISSRDPNFEELEREGFTKMDTKTGKHPKYYFYDERYWTLFSLSPSDKYAGNSALLQIRNRFFLVIK